MKYVTVLDKGFRPMYAEFKNYSAEVENSANKTLKICVERNDGYNYIYEYKIFADKEKADENNLMAGSARVFSRFRLRARRNSPLWK